jgi:uncharacterized protein (TIGR02145 family)
MNKKRTLSIFIILIAIIMNMKGQDTFIDKRDNQNYTVIKIDDLLWFAESLNYKTSDSECYELDSINCKKYGRLYTYYEAKKVCPNEWRLPTKKDIKKLKREMKSKTFESIINKEDWDTSEADIGNNQLGLSIKPGGRKYDDKYIPKENEGNPFFGKGISASFWLGSENYKNPRHWHINHFGGSQKMKVHKHGKPPKGAKLSILCVKDSDK